MTNKNQYLFGLKPHGVITMGLSLASTWAWGVSIIVGVQVIQGKGLLAFLIWAVANALALTLFGLTARNIPIKETIADVMPGVLKPLYHYFTMLIQFFSILVNITAIKMACLMLGLPAQSWHMLTFVLFAIVLVRGFDINIKGDVIFILIWIAVLSGVIAVMPKIDPVVIASGRSDIFWAVWGAVILLCGPVVDQQMWQRKVSMRGEFSMKPFLLGSVVFAVYMGLVGLLGIYGVHYPVAMAIIVVCVAGSTMQSALSALSCYGRTTTRGRWIMAGCFLLACGCLVFDLPVLTIWLLYGSLRVIPALYVFYQSLRRKTNGCI